jgi:hypothetical protein
MMNKKINSQNPEVLEEALFAWTHRDRLEIVANSLKEEGITPSFFSVAREQFKIISNGLEFGVEGILLLSDRYVTVLWFKAYLKEKVQGVPLTSLSAELNERLDNILARGKNGLHEHYLWCITHAFASRIRQLKALYESDTEE